VFLIEKYEKLQKLQQERQAARQSMLSSAKSGYISSEEEDLEETNVEEDYWLDQTDKLCAESEHGGPSPVMTPQTPHGSFLPPQGHMAGSSLKSIIKQKKIEKSKAITDSSELDLLEQIDEED